ncbi:MAG: dihydrolipoyl dehydrogenase [Candidatus Cloacimonadota bacterium]|nr:MAG: dihydrolipoyl dehydrogenase [Candidatus Cloacimonadota bacterium]
MKVNTLVIGAGPGGYVAGIRLGQLGIDTLVVEKENVGGVCLNVGCIPSKAMIHAAKSFYKASNEFSTFGVNIENISLDFEKMISWKDSITKKLTTGISGLLKANKVKHLKGTASFISNKKVKVLKADGSQEIIEFDNCIVATGSSPTAIPGFEVDQDKIVDSTGALSFKSLPKSLTIIGGGYIGLELGMVYAKLGTKVTVVEFLDSVLAAFDKDVIKVIEKKLKKLKVVVHTSAKAKSYTKSGNQVTLKFETKNGVKEVTSDHIFVSIGRVPNSKGLGLENIGVKIGERGFINVNDKLQTNVSNIYAIGDLVGQPMLAHKASKEGEIAAEVIAGHNSVLDIRQIPAVVFTDPEIAQAGVSETEAKAQGLNVKVSKFPYAAIGRAMTTNETEGFVKFISHKETNEVLGITIIGANASDLISEASLAIEMCAFTEDIALTVHAHPTFGEILMEAAKGNLGEAIHIINK